MNSAAAIFVKQLLDTVKNPGVLLQFIIYPGMTFLMTRVANVPGTQDSFFITMFASIFIGMTLIGSTATAIAEDREKNSLRFLLMAGVKSHEYLLGIGGVYFVCALAVSSLFVILMPDISIIERLVMLSSMMLGVTASILFGATIGMLSKNEQAAISVSTAIGSMLGFGPMIANLSGSAALGRIFGIFYTMNFVYEDFMTSGAIRRIGIILANVMILAVVFAWVYGKQESTHSGGIIMKLNRKIVAVLVAMAIFCSAGIAFGMWHNAGFLLTDNARVTTTLIPVSASTMGRLERFSISEGCYVEKNEIIGWVERSESIRSPISGLVIKSHAVQNQTVSPMEPLAVIADTNGIHIRANIKETDITRVKVGQSAIVTIDALGKQQFNGLVSAIGRITRAEITGTPLFFNIDGNFSRLTHLIPVEITLVGDANTIGLNLIDLVGVNARVRLLLRKPLIDLQPRVIEPVTSITTRRNVYTTMGAIIKQVNAELGDIVNEGDVLGLLDNNDLTQNAKIAEASLRIAEVNLTAAEHNHEILEALYSVRAIAHNDLRQSEFLLQSTIAAHEQARAILDTARAELERSVIRAPISGKVTAILAREGEIGSGRLFTIEDAGYVKIHSCSFLPCR